MLSDQGNDEKAAVCIRRAERAEAEAKAIHEQWTQYHVTQRARLIASYRWWERKPKPLTRKEAEILADISCKTDKEYQSAVSNNTWYLRQATAYGTVGQGQHVPQQRRQHGEVRTSGVR
jgi:hypothetical protein